jgi:phosphoesterase RecJ-like protein
MGHLLEAMGKRVTVVLADPVPHTFAGLPGAERILSTQPATTAEVAVVLECDSVARTGFAHLAAEWTVNIDHHQSGSAYATVNWIDPAAPAAGAMVYELAVASGVPISPELATCLYAAVLTDTVRFTLPSTTAETFGLVQHLLQLGADAPGVSQAVYNSHRLQKLRVLGLALRRLHIEGPVAWSAVTAEEISDADANVEDCEGVVQYVVGVEGVQAGAFLRELPEGGRFRASLRSKGEVDVASIAEQLGGGGHRNAAGCTVEGPLERAVERLTAFLHSACTEAALT